MKLTDSVVAGNSVGIDAREHVIVRGSDVSGNTGKGIAAWGNRRIKLLDSVVSSNGEHGVYVYRAATIKRSMLQNNGKNGILVYGFGYKNHLAISDSTLTGNGTSAECETTVVCADIATGDFPRLKRAICETSYQRDSDPPKSWGICSLD